MTGTVLLVIGVIGFTLAIGLLILRARRGLVGERTLLAAAGLCFAGLVIMNISDWPWEVLTEFWRDHAVVSATVSTLLLVGVGFLAFEVRDVQKQKSLDDGITAAGHSGLVDYLVQVEVALALVQQPAPPSQDMWAGWSRAERPLRWLRQHQDKLDKHDGKVNAADPRRFGPAHAADLVGQSDWRLDLLDQCVRRVISGIKGWAPVVGRSRVGLDTLLAFGKLRNRLLVLADLIDFSDGDADLEEAAKLLTSLRASCRANARKLENGVREPRAEVLGEDLSLAIDDDVLRHADARALDPTGKAPNRRPSIKGLLR